MASQDSIIGQVQVNNLSDNLLNDVIRGVKGVPFSNKNAMKYIQANDPDLCRPIARDWCLVVNKRSNINFISR